MRKALLFLLVITLLGCNREKIAQLEHANDTLQTNNTQLMEDVKLKEEYIRDYTATVNEIYDNLEMIRKREGYLSKHSKEVKKQDGATVRKQMLNNIASIDEALKKSKKRLQQLSARKNAFQNQADELSKTLESLSKTLDEKEVEIETYKTEVGRLSGRVAEVEDELMTREAQMARQAEALNTVYYIIGTEKELKDKGIITEEGGFLGIRKAKKLAANFNESDFQTADISATDYIEIDEKRKKVKLISPHRSDSFHLSEDSGDITRLEIIDPDEFWKMKYLVILTKS